MWMCEREKGGNENEEAEDKFWKCTKERKSNKVTSVNVTKI